MGVRRISRAVLSLSKAVTRPTSRSTTGVAARDAVPRHRSAAALSRAASFAVERRSLLAQARRAVDAGVDLIQVRERDLEAASLAALVADIVAIARGTPTRVVVNDRLDVALACGADGVHLRGDSIPVEAARRLAPPAVPHRPLGAQRRRSEGAAPGPTT